MCVKLCPECQRAFYPSFYENGIIFVHNKFAISVEFILDLSLLLQTGGGFIEAIKKKLLLLAQIEGFDRSVFEKDINSMALKLEKLTIAILALVLKGSDLDEVMCYLCGNCPKIVRKAIIYFDIQYR